MLSRVVERHGDRMPETLLPLQKTFETMQRELLDHMAREDAVLFPLIAELDRRGAPGAESKEAAWIGAIVSRMTAEHDSVGAALQEMRQLTHDYTLPDWACPTFIGLYHGLTEFERDMQVHVHLENAILFPRAVGEPQAANG
jgi:regulator of cell morphogenesis and NO signaling